MTSANARNATSPVTRYLANVALQSARRWMFRPAQRNGVAVASAYELEVKFEPAKPSFVPQR